MLTVRMRFGVGASTVYPNGNWPSRFSISMSDGIIAVLPEGSMVGTPFEATPKVILFDVSGTWIL